MPRPNQIILNAWINSSGSADDGWRRDDLPLERIFDLEYYVSAAEIAHRGVFSNVFLSDRPQLIIDETKRPEHTIDPLILLSAVLARVPDIGGIVTATTTYSSPYTLARQLQSANLLTEGRIGWNVVTTWHPAVAANYGGSDLPGRETRYARAEEFLRIVSNLWSSWDFPWSRPLGDDEPFFGTVRAIDHRTPAFEVAGPLNVPAYRGRRPFIVQAGGSDRGIALAGAWADMVYATVSSPASTAQFRDRLKKAATAAGRTDSPLLVPAISPAILSTEAEVDALRDDEDARAADRAAEEIQSLAERLGVDLSQVGTTEPLRPENIRIPANPVLPLGVLNALAVDAITHGWSLAELARAQHRNPFAGTPEQVAAQIDQWWTDDIVDGFTISPQRLPDDLGLFVDTVVPLLQESGHYPREYDESFRFEFAAPTPR